MKKVFWMALIVCAGALCRWPLTFWHHPFYNSDTAVPDLMARHFAAGEWSFYYWGQSYYGVLDSLILMPLFRLFGQSPQTSQLIPFGGSLLLLVLVYLLLFRTEGLVAALLSALLLAVPPLVLIGIPYTTYIYILGPLLGMVQLLWWERMKRGPRPLKVWFAGGLVAGISWYYTHFILLFWIGILLDAWVRALGDRRPRLVWREMAASGKRHTLAFLRLEGSWIPDPWRTFLRFLSALNLGTLALAGLLWIHGDFSRRTPTRHILVSFSDTAGVALKIYAAIALIAYGDKLRRWLAEAWENPAFLWEAAGFLLGSSPVLLALLWGHFPGEPGKFVTLPELWANLKVLATIFLPAYAGGDWLSGLIFLLAFGFVMRRIILWWRRCAPPPPTLVWAALANLVIGLFGIALWDAGQIRYFMVFLLALPLGIAWAIEAIPARGRWAAGSLLVGLALFINGRSIARAGRSGGDLRGDEAAVEYLVKSHLTAGFADYWISYKLMALSHERVMIEPTDGNDRYPPHRRVLEQTAEPFFLARAPLPPGGALRLRGQDFLVQSCERAGGLYVMRLDRPGPLIC